MLLPGSRKLSRGMVGLPREAKGLTAGAGLDGAVDGR